jgi:hypothetical protein
MLRASFVYDFSNAALTIRRISPSLACIADFMRYRTEMPF